MRLFLCLALALAGCGDPADGYVGAYSVVGLANKLTINGSTRTTPVTVPSGTKLVITKLTTGNVLLSLGGAELERARCAGATCETIGRFDTVDDGSCDYSTTWNAGTLKFEGGVLEMKRSGTTSATCTNTSSNFTNAPGEQTLQATKD